jgi:hypothetical protein
MKGKIRLVVQQLMALFLCLLLLAAAACNADVSNATVSPLDPWQEKQVLYDLVFTTLHGDQAQLVVDELSHQFHQDGEWLARH